MNKKTTTMLLLLSLLAMTAQAQKYDNGEEEKVDRMPKINGTIRSKYEYQTEEGEGRFEVRTARVSVSGNVTKEVSYKAEIDLCDEGKIKMLDAYTRIKPWSTLQFTIGQERVPFTIDAHRSPHQQYLPTARLSPSRWVMYVTWVPRWVIPGMSVSPSW